MYYINYYTGAGNFTYDGTLEEAKKEADKGAGYTQQSYAILDEDENVVAVRRWCGMEYDMEEDGEENPILFGSFGYYADWENE